MKAITLMLLLLLGLGLFAELMSQSNISVVYASPYPSSGDSWTENNSGWTEAYGNPLSWSTNAKNGTYSLQAVHTLSGTSMTYTYDATAYAVSAYDYAYFWFYANVSKAFTLYFYKTATSTSFNVYITARVGWDLFIVPLKSFTKTGSPSWADLRYARVNFGGVLTAYGFEMFRIDGLHFAKYDDLNIVTNNDVDELLLTRLSHFVHNASWSATGSYPESLYAWKNTGTEVQSNGLETESLGQTLFAYGLLYNLTNYSFYLDKIKTYTNALYYFQNKTVGKTGYGGFGYGRTDTGQRTLVNAWIQFGLLYAYSFTGNATYLSMVNMQNYWLADTMWNATNNRFNHHYQPNTNAMTYGTLFDAERDGVAAGALALYTRVVGANATLTAIVDNVMAQLLAVSTYKLYASFGALTEITTYAFWGIYEAYKASDSTIYREAFLNSSNRFIWSYLRDWNHNGSVTYRHENYRTDNTTDGRISGWGHMVGLYHLALAYEISGKTYYRDLLAKMLWDYLPQIVFTGDGNNGAITFLYNAVGSSAVYNSKAYTPTPAFALLAVQWYYLNVEAPTTTSGAYLVDATNKITVVTHSASDVRFTVSASSGVTSITRLYVGTNGEPKTVTGVNAHSYNSTSRVSSSTVLHASDVEVRVSWVAEGFASGKYSLTVLVSLNLLPTIAVVEIDGVNQTTNLLGQTHWLLPYGSYDVQAYYGEQNQSMTVMLNEDKTVGFNFTVLPKPLNFTSLILVLVVVVGVAMVFLFFRRKH